MNYGTLLLAVSLAFPAAALAQTTHRLTWQPGNLILQTPGGEVRTVSFEGAAFDQDRKMLPQYYIYQPLESAGAVSVALVDPVFESMSEIIDGVGYISDEVGITAHVVFEKKMPRASITITPLRVAANGQLERLVEFGVKISQTETHSAPRRGTTFASNSVLSSGNWYKFSTESNGVYKLDYNFLKNELGFPVDQVDPRHIRIYGNGGGMLPELNSAFRHDDLYENAIVVIGESDGAFGTSDYILFYGTGADQWVEQGSTQGYRHVKHLYDTKACYFITADLGTGKRIGNQPSSPSSPTYPVTEFDDHLFFEEELYKLNESGKEWFGQQFDRNTTTQTYTFNLPYLTSDTVHIYSRFAGRSLAGNNTFRVYVNDVFIGQVNLASVPNDFGADFGREGTVVGQLGGLSSPIEIEVEFVASPSDLNAHGWINYIEVVGRRQLKTSSGQMTFRDGHSAGSGMISEFQLQSAASSLTIWDVTNPLEPRAQDKTSSAGVYTFRVATDSLKEFIAFDGGSFLTPTALGKINNQDLHGTIGQPDLVIITPAVFESYAEQLGTHHADWDNMDVAVVELSKIYNEFSSGVQDVSALRDMMRMLYERAANADELPQYLILFGDGSFDYKNIEFSATENTNFVPTYQSAEVLRTNTTYTSDDFFAFLDPNEGANIHDTPAQKLDLAVGRLVASNTAEAQAVVNKIIHYATKGAGSGIGCEGEGGTFGSWRNIVTFIGDDEDGDLHLEDADALAKIVEQNHPVYNVDKIYLDAYQQVSTSGGARYPDVNTAISNRIFSGTLILNYTGHGGEVGWAHERIFSSNDLNDWENLDKLTLFVTATCSFSKFDNPAVKTAGEKSFVKSDGGTIGLVTTVRIVYASANYAMNEPFMKNVFKKTNGKRPTLGEVMVMAKNIAPASENNRKFILIGDPAMTLAYPHHNVRTTHVDSVPFVQNGDTLSALSKVTIRGEVTDESGSKLTAFNGYVFPTIYDKPVNITTLKNDPGSSHKTFRLQKNIIYKGKASVTSGEFSFTFIVPKDISYNSGSGKISYYAHTDTEDAHGFDSIVIGGSATNAPVDDQGPAVSLYMNDENFAFGGFTDDSPLLLVKLTDESGINTSGMAIGHDISSVMDEDDQNKIVLNEFYEADLDDYQSGQVRYPFSNLEPGTHKLTVKAWDTYNNPGEGYTEFVVAESAKLALKHVLNYPNPFTTQTTFWFEHNRPCENLEVRIEIYSIAGKLVKTLLQDIHDEGYLVNDIAWDGLDEYGDPIGRGVYVYKVKVTAPDGSEATQFEKLVLLR